MAVTANPYGLSFKGLGLGRFNFTTDTFKVMLTTASYLPNFDTDEFKSVVTNEVASGNGYTTGGMALTGLTWAYDATNDGCLLTCTAPVWSNASFTARRAVIYKDSGDAATSPLLSWVDFGANATPAGTPFTITFSNGVYRIKVGS